MIIFHTSQCQYFLHRDKFKVTDNVKLPLHSSILEYLLKSVTNLSRQIVQEGPKTETQLLQMIGRKSDLLELRIENAIWHENVL